jgi:hypothetical protein
MLVYRGWLDNVMVMIMFIMVITILINVNYFVDVLLYLYVIVYRCKLNHGLIKMAKIMKIKN